MITKGRYQRSRNISETLIWRRMSKKSSCFLPGWEKSPTASFTPDKIPSFFWDFCNCCRRSKIICNSHCYRFEQEETYFCKSFKYFEWLFFVQDLLKNDIFSSHLFTRIFQLFEMKVLNVFTLLYYAQWIIGSTLTLHHLCNSIFSNANEKKFNAKLRQCSSVCFPQLWKWWQ